MNDDSYDQVAALPAWPVDTLGFFVHSNYHKKHSRVCPCLRCDVSPKITTQTIFKLIQLQKRLHYKLPTK